MDSLNEKEKKQDMEKYSGIAPVIKASGKIRLVQRRFARPVFLHQSFIEYVDQSLRHHHISYL